jgi:hypothetical protein
MLRIVAQAATYGDTAIWQFMEPHAAEGSRHRRHRFRSRLLWTAEGPGATHDLRAIRKNGEANPFDVGADAVSRYFAVVNACATAARIRATSK